MHGVGNFAPFASLRRCPIENLLRELQSSGVTFKVVGTRVTAAGPPEVLTPPVVAQLREHKDELLQLLVPRREVVTPAACGWCGQGLAPFLLDVGGKPALLCPSCHRWTYPGGAA
jgi:hypothetical protein